jgi:hypothetical protein
MLIACAEGDLFGTSTIMLMGDRHPVAIFGVNLKWT